MYKIKTLNKISEQGLEIFDDNYEVGDDLEHEDGILVRSAKLHDYDFPTELKAIARAGAGVNNIPVDKCTEKGICVFNTPGANANAVKELVLCALILSSRQVIPGIEWVKTLPADDFGKAVEKGKSQFVGPEIDGKKLGVIGLGAIGVNVANAAVKLGMEVYGYDPYISVNAAWNLSRGVKHVQDVTEIYKECDYITVHVPLMDSTKKMISKEAIAMMKPTAVVLNFARDLLVDEEAMVEALKEKKVRKYVSDFPNPTTVGKEGTIVTPHIGASTEESEDNCAVMAVNEIMDFLENGNITHSVNYPDCNMGICQAAGRVLILHKNEKGMISRYTTVLGDADINISDMTNKSRGEFACTLMDVDAALTDEVVEKLKAVDGVLRVRVIK